MIEFTLEVTVKDGLTGKSGALIMVRPQDRDILITDGEGLTDRYTNDKGSVTFEISGEIGQDIVVICKPPDGFKIDGLYPEQLEFSIPLRFSLPEDVVVRKKDLFFPLEIEQDASGEQLNVEALNRTLRFIAVNVPQDGGGFAPGGALDGAHARKKIDGAVAKVLGRSIGADPYTFLSVLRSTFPEDPEEGQIVREPVRTYVSMIAESGQISAAQGTLSREVALIANEARTVLGSLRSIAADTDHEVAEALTELIRADLDALIVEASRVDRPRPRRVKEILGNNFKSGAMRNQLSKLETALGLGGADDLDNQNLVTPVEAQLLAAMDLLERYVETLGGAFDRFFTTTEDAPDDKSFSGRLAFTAQLLAALGQSVRDLRDTLAAVDLSQAECQTTFIDDNGEPISIESILSWIESLADIEGPDLIARGGRLGLNRVIDVVEDHLSLLVGSLLDEANNIDPPPAHPGLGQPAVVAALEELQNLLAQFTPPAPAGSPAR